MLVLTRKSKESVMIGGNIEVRVLSVRGDQVSLGFTAPDEVSIYRKEVYEAVQKENLEAVHRGATPVPWLRTALHDLFPQHFSENTERKEGCQDGC